LISSPNINPADYKELLPMFVFDVTKQSKKLKNSVTDIQIKALFSANIAANTELSPLSSVIKVSFSRAMGRKCVLNIKFKK